MTSTSISSAGVAVAGDDLAAGGAQGLAPAALPSFVASGQQDARGFSYLGDYIAVDLQLGDRVLGMQRHEV